MKRLLLILTTVAATSCIHRSVVPIPGPSVGAVKSGISQAQTQLAAAEASAEEIGGHITSARTKASRIDGKAKVILDHWQ